MDVRVVVLICDVSGIRKWSDFIDSDTTMCKIYIKDNLHSTQYSEKNNLGI